MYLKKSHYIRQKFLVDEISSSDDAGIQYDESVKLEDIQDFSQGRNLFDVDSFYRKVRMSDFDRTVDTEEDFDSFVNRVKDVDCLYIVNDLPTVDNPIYQEFSTYCMRSLSKRLSERHIHCRFVRSEKSTSRPPDDVI